MTTSDWISLVSALAACVSVLVAAYAIHRSSTISKILKRADVAMHCTLRYEELKRLAVGIDEKYREVLTDKDKEIEHREALRMQWTHYYSRYWALKSDQFDFWLYGLLEHGTFLDWSYSTALSFLRDKSTEEEGRDKARRVTCPFPYQQAWDTWKANDHGPVNPNFVRFTERLIEVANTSNPRGLSWNLVFNELLNLHGTFWRPGVAAQVQKQAWAGLSLKKLEKVLRSNESWRI